MNVLIKERYGVARSLIRANGRYAMRWVAPDLREAMNHFLDSSEHIDFLELRQHWGGGPDSFRLTTTSTFLFSRQAY